MSETSIPLRLPIDDDGFLRRECPNCDRQFKWYPTYSGEDPAWEPADSPTTAPDFYFCPYCREPAAPGSWWTQAQIEFAKQMAMNEVVLPELTRAFGGLGRLNQPGSLLRFEIKMPEAAPPDPLFEPNDMMRIDLPCHPEEPLKVDDSWDAEVACLVCGIHYPVKLVRRLSDVEHGGVE